MDDSRARKYQLSKVLAVLVTAALAAVLAIASPAAADTTVTTTDLTSDLNPSTYGDAITLTATVTGDAPTGSVTFTDGATTLDVVALVGGVAVLVTDELTAGDHTIVATYGGDLGNDPSTSTGLVQSVESVETATNLDSDANPSQYGDSVTLTATVIGGDPTGTVSFDDGATHLGDGTVTDGEATLTTSTLSVGDHTITATYAGDANHDGSTSNNLVQTVAVVGTTTLLESSANPSDFGEAVTFTATVLGDSPTGSVSFDDGATHLGDGTVTDGEATLTTSALSVGSHTVTATYSGDTNNDMSVSAELVQSVGVVGTTTTVVSDANPSVLGDLVTFTATVTGADPTGTVTFTDGATVLGSAPVDGSGEASLETSTLAVGAHTITATYSGDDNNGVSSDDLVQTVDKLGTATTLASSLNPSTTADSVTLTATVTGGPTPTGSVTFKDGATVLGSANLNGSGVATLGAGPFTAGAHSLTATYGGDANHVGSSGSLTQTSTAPVVPPVVPPVTPPVTPPTPPPPPKPTVTFDISTDKASVGDKVTLKWSTKHAETVTASGDWRGARPTKGTAKVRMGERGTYVFKLTVANASGKQTATVQVVASRKAKELELVVTDELVLVGTPVAVRADGLAQGETYTIRLAGKVLISGKADKKGDVNKTFTLPTTTAEGAVPLTITGSNPGRKGEAVLNVIKPKTLEVEVADDKVRKNEEQTVTVSGLLAGEEVKVMYLGKKITTGTADANGEFTYAFNVGAEKGKRKVKVIGAVPSRVGEAEFAVTRDGGDVGGHEDGL